MRIKEHPVLNFKRGQKLTFTFNGRQIEAFEGETIAAALHAAGVWQYSESERLERPRGLFCAIGHCSSCLMTVDGMENVRTCVMPVKSGMVVEKKRKAGEA